MGERSPRIRGKIYELAFPTCALNESMDNDETDLEVVIVLENGGITAATVQSAAITGDFPGGCRDDFPRGCRDWTGALA